MYPQARARHAFAVLLALNGKDARGLGGKDWAGYLERALATLEMIVEQTVATRAKDFAGAIHQMTCESPEEKAAVFGSIDDDPFIARVREETGIFRERLAQIRQRNGLGG